VVVDGYHFIPEYHEVLRAGGRRVLAVDDMVHLRRYPADALLNQNLSADASRYESRVENGTALLLGPRYALLRREFRAVAADRRLPARPPRRVLVSFGGGDHENFTGRILANLAAGDSRHLEVKVLAGAANPHADTLRQQVAGLPFACEIRVAEENVADVMAWADAAVTAAGSTVWELAALRLPALIGGHEDNQLSGLASLGRVPAFRAWTVEQLLAQDLAAQLATLPPFPPYDDFDADGASRVVAHLQALSSRFVPQRIVA
jgi:UDP-2,4-diacetamido-2,4,6-trideoxy-beta-L-altropyranose hydrolase